MDYDVIIIGAGASGLMAAIAAARHGSSVLVIERKDKAGKKILATGNGKCNFTNMVQKPECYRSDDSAFVMKVLSCFDVQNTLDFFGELGIYPKNRDGYLYPNSEQASSVVQILIMECKRLKVKFEYNSTVVEVKNPYYTIITETILQEENKDKLPASKNKKDKLPINTERNSFHASKLILAAGGCASPQLGSDGSGYRIAKSLGHTIIKPVPALVQLKSPDKFCKTVSGVRTTAKVTAFEGQNKLADEEGEVLFADYGISGIPILQISRFVAKALEQRAKVHLTLDFLPELEVEKIITMLKLRIQQNPSKSLEEMLVGLFNHKLAYVLILEAVLDPYKLSQKITNQEIIKLAEQIKKFRINISDTNSFENAQVSAGGVVTKEINENTMESKLLSNMYFAGEVVDVDGTCGGYNLQWAWSSGYLAGTSAGKKE